ncbi:uncharacterized protein BDZ99DRAFT_482977 [Mytilinidion resinicola]|uniref:Uncharacterized protein n=1 Tax=Mytilinidion resinicola TaxID=574789 RepID=A0A6A6Y0D6_9PEZI|nr:uncharacterized protein BDZ99DRAFT_482977 [Mytilinidion resinicola]KAF2802232.1 hypothetical protein BDZ99DRAFT_482977 [Mytilinidion resinicola]
MGLNWTLFYEVARGINAVRSHARIIGVLLVTPMTHARVNEMDEKLLRFARAFCGDEYMTQVTDVTTFWEAHKEKQKQGLNTRLANRLEKVKELWSVHRPLRHYQHGREYEDGQDKGVFLDWEDDRDNIAEHAKDMVHRHYGHINPRDPRIVQDLATGLPLERTAAGQFLGLIPARAPDSTSKSNTSSSSAAPEPKEQGYWEYGLDIISAIARNVHFEANIGPIGGASGNRTGSSLPQIPMGPRYNGPIGE